MELNLTHLIKDISTIDQDDILSEWRWLLPDVTAVVMVTCMGDMFVERENGNILFLLYDGGDLEIVAENKAEFESYLKDEEKCDNWFLPLLFEKLVAAGKQLKENQVYSLKLMGILGGEYIVENIEPADMSVHFGVAGQINRQIWDLPDGTKINKVIVE